jgi:hypothetical protein
MRYTEARLRKIAEEMLEDIDKKIQDMESRVRRFQEFQVEAPGAEQQGAPPVPRGYIS